MNRLVGVAALALIAPIAAASAELVLVGPVTIGGTGLGTVNTVLTIQSSGNNTSEQGCVIGTGTDTGNLVANSCVIGSNTDVKTGASQTQTRTLAEAGITSGSNFAILFNAAEPGGDAISLNNLVAYFTSSGGSNSGTVLTATLSCGSACNFASSQTGTGNTGYEFVLNATEAAALQSFITAAGGVGNVHVGLGALAGTTSGFEATGGNETFFIFNSGIATPVPEPATLGLMATGLFGLGAVARRRRRR